MFGLEILAKLFKILRAEDTPNQIASGFFLGMIIGLTPFPCIHTAESPCDLYFKSECRISAFCLCPVQRNGLFI